MPSNNVIDPADIPAIAVPSMDATHHEEVALVNAIGQLLRRAEAGASVSAELQKSLQDWLEHTRAHFARENRLMADAAFPAYLVHRQEHAQALAGLEAVITTWQDEGELHALRNYVFETWPAWFRQHVSSMDSVTALYLAQQGIR